MKSAEEIRGDDGYIFKMSKISALGLKVELFYSQQSTL